MKTLLHCRAALALAALLGALGVLAFTAPRRSGTPAARLGRVAPDFDLSDTEGRAWHLRRLRGEPLLIVFACGCVDCQRLLSALGQTPRLSARVLVISSVAPTDLGRLVAERGGRLNGLFDPFGRVAQVYSSTRCPRVWALDRQQTVRYVSEPGAVRPANVIPAALKAINVSCDASVRRLGEAGGHGS